MSLLELCTGAATSVLVENNVNLLQIQKWPEVPSVPIDAHLTAELLLAWPTIWREDRRVDLF